MRNKLRGVDVARQFNRTVSWLRSLERQGIIPAPPRDPLNGARVYDPADVDKIREAVLSRRMAG